MNSTNNKLNTSALPAIISSEDIVRTVYNKKKIQKYMIKNLYDNKMLIIVNHKEKYIIPCDLKTSSHREYDFPKSFVQWHYQCQARLYSRLLRQAMDKDEYFKDFKLLNYRFIVVNNIDNPIPLVWEFTKTASVGEIEIGGTKFRDPEVIGKELTYYLDNRPSVPLGINLDKPNNIERWFDEKQ